VQGVNSAGWEPSSSIRLGCRELHGVRVPCPLLAYAAKIVVVETVVLDTYVAYWHIPSRENRDYLKRWFSYIENPGKW